MLFRSGNFNYITVEEKQPYDYTTWINVYDPYPDPLESICLVIKNGTGSFNIDFGNPYASHFPYWWHWTTSPSSASWESREHVNSINEPIAFQINTSSRTISQLGADGSYTDMYSYTMVSESDDEGTITGYHYEITNSTGSLVYKTSGDEVLDSENNTAYTVEGINISGLEIYGLGRTVPSVKGVKLYDTSGKLAYTLEEETDNNIKYIYVCEVRSVTESVKIDGFEDYTFTFNPHTEQTVNPGEYYTANVQLRSLYGNDYGSTLGNITFRQAADLATGYTGYRENSPIPLVIANVYDGDAADEPLQFDMTIYDSETVKTADHVINRVKFRWDAQQDITQDFGTFFMIRPSGQAMPTYYLETQITNRTGTRYRLYRYDMLGQTTGYQEIRPAHWKYDLPLSPEELKRRTLPPYFHLDAQSQIAPGLVTVYDNSVYGTMNTAYDTYESFQLHDYDNSVPKSLRLNYKRVGGMNLIEGAEELLYSYSESSESGSEGVRTREFIMQFADVVKDDDETVYELENLMGKPPAMITASEASFRAAASKSKVTSHDFPVYINATALDAFRYLKPVPDGMITMKTISEDTDLGDSSSYTQQGGAEAAEFSAADTTTVSAEIALQPLSIRMRIPRTNQLVIDHWSEFESATSSRALFNAFARYGTVWLRSDYTEEKDRNLFSAIDEAEGAAAVDCVRAFIFEDALYLDFIVILADAKSQKPGGGAFLRIFHDDGIPYVLIGDGNENGEWDMTFYVAATGDNPTPRNSTPSLNPETNTNNTSSGDSGGGGGCDLGLLGIVSVLALAGILRKSRA